VERQMCDLRQPQLGWLGRLDALVGDSKRREISAHTIRYDYFYNDVNPSQLALISLDIAQMPWNDLISIY